VTYACPRSCTTKHRLLGRLLPPQRAEGHHLDHPRRGRRGNRARARSRVASSPGACTRWPTRTHLTPTARAATRSRTAGLRPQLCTGGSPIGRMLSASLRSWHLPTFEGTQRKLPIHTISAMCTTGSATIILAIPPPGSRVSLFPRVAVQLREGVGWDLSRARGARRHSWGACTRTRERVHRAGPVRVRAARRDAHADG